MFKKNYKFDFNKIKKELEEKGYFVILDALEKDYFEEMFNETEKEMDKKPEINVNELQGVYSNNQFFDRFMMAK